MSSVLLVLVFAVALGGIAWSLQALEKRAVVRADDDGLESAAVIAASLVQPHLHAADVLAGQLTADDIGEMQAAATVLRRDGRLIGLGVWRLDGSPLFLDDAFAEGRMRLSDADLQRAASGEPWTVHRVDPDGEGHLEVTIPVPSEGASDTAVASVVKVVLPRADLTPAALERLDRQQAWTALILLSPVLGLVLLQWRLRRRQEERRRDPLTGLLNGRALTDDCTRLLAKASDRRPLALLVIDLTEFKTVNSTLGHPAGDMLLQQVAAALKAAVRQGDRVFRLGGDEFAVLLRDLRDASGAQKRAESLLRHLREASFRVDGVDLVVDAGIGVTLAPEHGTTVADLLQRADVAMYQAKRAESGTMIYDASTDEHDVGELAMGTELRRALENEEFVLHYQPKVALADQCVTSVEALVRWQHPTRGLLPPGVFLPALERSGLMQPLTRWVLREAIRQAASWRRAGMPLAVAVNISPRSLLEDDLPARVLAKLLAADLPASFLELEITETAVMTDPKKAALVLAQLNARGIKVSIDDFGAGYTSLAHLRTLPISALKIDRSLISHMLERDEDHAVTEALIGLGHRLGLTVIAEGIETDEVLDRLTQLGCDEAQGYLISKPVAPDALEGWMAARAVDQGSPSAQVS
ncbi:putative bifunctional diguanylate cyclase/phosphodiesterase [Blastococcus tunisiensis]|uniref:Diguanylate cyclase (GGDEF) domain-containing protein n=1 Tax=Blastococcus tunisiensis TaxID=1798228 RepID=A0A1I2K6A3_9ACTN|nr:bifunctional diguanylate cyclase/phosphodiesterase [Blastococcus sp. DSM 46838]SFF61869.1 diguanylate cyclase (GGDEF) domain-containing protein [Blastococcus sp. DSM 46838]